MGEGDYEFGLAKYFCSYFTSDFLHAINSYNITCHKLLQHGAPGFTSASKKGMLQIFVMNINGV
jgi:hypothetical protein